MRIIVDTSAWVDFLSKILSKDRDFELKEENKLLILLLRGTLGNTTFDRTMLV